MAEVVFFVVGILVIAGAVGVVVFDNPFYSVLALVSHLLSLAALFLLLRAEFVAAAQVVVYAGAVMVLYVFVVAYIGGDEPRMENAGRPLKVIGPLCAVALLVELCIAALGSGLSAVSSKGAGYVPGFGSAREIGRLLLTRFLFVFEVASFLLLVAAVGAVVLARRRRGLDEADPAGPRPVGISAAQIAQIPRTGTMAEGVGERVRTPAGEPAPTA